MTTCDHQLLAAYLDGELSEPDLAKLEALLEKLCRESTANGRVGVGAFSGVIEGDHQVPHALGGETSLANDAPRCRVDHRTKTNREAARTIKAGRAAAAARRTAS